MFVDVMVDFGVYKFTGVSWLSFKLSAWKITAPSGLEGRDLVLGIHIPWIQHIRRVRR